MNPRILNKPSVSAFGFGIALLLAALASGQARAAGMPAEASAQANVHISGSQGTMPAASMQAMSYDAAKNGASAPAGSHDKANKKKNEGGKKE